MNGWCANPLQTARSASWRVPEVWFSFPVPIKSAVGVPALTSIRRNGPPAPRLPVPAFPCAQT